MLALIYEAVVALLGRFGEQLVISLGITAIVTELNKLLGGQSGAPSWQVVANDVVTIEAQQVDPVFGLSAIATLIAVARDDILAAVALTQQSGTPVTLPATTPAGGGWVDQSNVGTNIWDYVETLGDVTPYINLQFAGLWAQFRQNYGLGPELGDWLVAGNWYPRGDAGWTIAEPTLDPSTILPGDDLLSWIARTNPSFTCTWFNGVGNVVQLQETIVTADIHQFYTTIDGGYFALLMASLFPVAAAGAPIWPGLSGVTLGTPVALSDGLVLAGPLAGILIDITAVAPPVSYYPFGSIRSYVRAGAVVFTTDRGDSEFPEPFGPANQLITPKTMEVAASATLRVTSGIVGTVTPFTIP